MNEQSVVIIGAGPTGLSAAYHLGKAAVLLDKNERVGGWCRSIVDNGFTFDFAGHIMFSNDKYVHELYAMLLGDNVHWQDREAWVYSKNVYTRYPFQGALYGLPPEVIKECLLGAIEARFGALHPEMPKSENGVPVKANGNGNGRSNGNGHSSLNPGLLATAANGGAAKGLAQKELEDCCADGTVESVTPVNSENCALAPEAPSNEPRNFEEFIYKVWGAGIAKHFAIPYNKKLWAVPLTEMETSWLGGRVPLPDLAEMIDGALKPVPKPMGPNARFGYPLRGGFQALMDGFLPHLRGPVRLKSSVRGVSARQRRLQTSDGRTVPYEVLVSTMPLPTLVRLLGDEAPSAVQDAAAALRHVSVRCVHLGIGRPALTEKHWIYYPEDTVFHRVFVQGNASPHCNPPGGFGLTCEITYSPHKPLPAEGDALVARCLADCRKVGLVGDDDPLWAAATVDLPHAYVVYDHARAENVALVRRWLEQHDIVVAGRYAEWEYYNSDHAFLAGRTAAETAAARRRPTALLRAKTVASRAEQTL